MSLLDEAATRGACLLATAALPHTPCTAPLPCRIFMQYYHDGDVVQGVVCLNIVTPVVITSIECQVRGGGWGVMSAAGSCLGSGQRWQ